MAKRNPFLAEMRCPSCHASLDAARAPDGRRKPKPGDVTVCGYCQSVLQFTVLGLAIASDEVLIAIAGDPGFVKANEMAAEYRSKRPRPLIFA